MGPIQVSSTCSPSRASVTTKARLRAWSFAASPDASSHVSARRGPASSRSASTRAGRALPTRAWTAAPAVFRPTGGRPRRTVRPSMAGARASATSTSGVSSRRDSGQGARKSPPPPWGPNSHTTSGCTRPFNARCTNPATPKSPSRRKLAWMLGHAAASSAHQVSMSASFASRAADSAGERETGKRQRRPAFISGWRRSPPAVCAGLPNGAAPPREGASPEGPRPEPRDGLGRAASAPTDSTRPALAGAPCVNRRDR